MILEDFLLIFCDFFFFLNKRVNFFLLLLNFFILRLLLKTKNGLQLAITSLIILVLPKGHNSPAQELEEGPRSGPYLLVP